MDFQELMDQKTRSTLQKYVLGIIAAQAVLLCLWASLYPDTQVENYDSVKKALNLMQNEAPVRPEIAMASAAMHSAAKNLELLNSVVLLASLSILILSILTLVKVSKIRKPL